jgi:hypothetical protein
MPRILVPNPRACQVCLHCIGFSLSYALHSRNHICFIPIFSLVCLEENFYKYLMGMTEKACRAIVFLFW